MVNVRVTKGTEDGQNGNTTTTTAAAAAAATTGGAAFSLVESSAITYIMSPHLVQKFAHPSPQYLTAVYRTLTSSFPEFAGRAIEICDHTGERGGTAEPAESLRVLHTYKSRSTGRQWSGEVVLALKG